MRDGNLEDLGLDTDRVPPFVVMLPPMAGAAQEEPTLSVCCNSEMEAFR